MMRRLSILTLALALVPFAAPGQAAGDPIQPGDFAETSIGGCTLNFVFDGTGSLAGNVYMGIAAHCVTNVGEPVSSTGRPNFGTVAFIGDADVTERDYAFIKVNDALEADVRADVLGHPGQPVGGFTLAQQTSAGNVLTYSGYGLGFGTTAPTRERRAGVLLSDDSKMYTMEGPIIFGDSGGPILHQNGKAYGIQSRIIAGGVWCCAMIGPGAWMEGPTVQGLINDAAVSGFTVALRNAA